MIYSRHRIEVRAYEFSTFISPLCTIKCVTHNRTITSNSVPRSDEIHKVHTRFWNVRSNVIHDASKVLPICRKFSNTCVLNRNNFRVHRSQTSKLEKNEHAYSEQNEDERTDAFLANTKFCSVEQPHTAPPKPGIFRSAISALFDKKLPTHNEQLSQVIKKSKENEADRLDSVASTNYLIIPNASLTRVSQNNKYRTETEDKNASSSFDLPVLLQLLSHNSNEERNFGLILQSDYSSLKSLFNKKFLKHEIQIPDFGSIPLLRTFLMKRDYGQALSIVKVNFKSGNILTPQEFVQLLTILYPKKKLAFSLVGMYAQKYDISAFDHECKRKILQLAYYNGDFPMFDELFRSFPNNSKISTPSLLSIALKAYIDSDRIDTAVRLFDFSVKSREKLPCYVLDTYIKDLQRVTHNAELCYNAYRLWISANLQTWPQTDALVYQFLRRFGTLEQQDWFMGCLTRKGRATHPEILMVDLTSKLVSRANMKHFYSTGGYQKWISLLKSDNTLLDKFKTKMFDLNMVHGLYDNVVHILRESTTEKDFLRRLDKLLIHLKSYGQSHTLGEFLLKLHKEMGLKIHPYYIENILRCLQAEHPEHSLEIKDLFCKFFSDDNTGKNSHMKIKLEKQLTPLNNVIGKRHNSSRKINDMTILAVENRAKSGIHPVQYDLLIAMKKCKSIDDFRRTIRLIYKYQGELNADNLKFQIEAFWKQRDLRISIPGGRSARTFLKKVLNDEHIFNSATLYDIIRLVMMSTKFNDFDVGIELLKRLQKRNLKPSNRAEMERFAYCLLNFFFKKGDFKSVLLILEEINKTEGFPISMQLVENLENIRSKYSGEIIRQLENEQEDDAGNNTVNQMALKKAVYSKVMKYYSNTTLQMHNTALKQSQNIDHEIEYFARRFKDWMNEEYTLRQYK